MASMSHALPDGRSSGDGPAIVRVPPARRREALGVLLTGRGQEDQPAVAQFERFAREQDLSLDQFWASLDGRRIAHACLLVPSPGRSAMLFLSPVAGLSRVAAAARLAGTVLAIAAEEAVQIVQALLDPYQSIERRALLQAGFTSLATLAYLQRPLDETFRPMQFDEAGYETSPPGQPAPPEPLRAIHWHEDRREQFARAIEASYEDTLDCPGLVGLRETSDVIAGHMATGIFTPELWTALYRGDEPAGVMLLAEIPSRQALELVYIGLATAERGKGLAKRLLSHGQWLGAQRGLTRMLLAVDEANAPAKRMYDALGYHTVAHKQALIASPKPGP